MINLKELKQNLSEFAELQAQRAEEYRLNHLLHEDTKFKFAYLSLEITRKCNLKCAHCMRGDAQHLSMKKEVIDKILDSSAGIRTILFTGGEPFLEPDLIEYVVDQVIERDFECFGMGVVTNGTIMNDNGIRCVKAMNKFAEWSNKKYGNLGMALIEISNDHFHDTEASDTCFKFYKPYIGEFTELNMHGDIQLVNVGRATQTDVAMKDTRKVHALPRRICIETDNDIRCSLDLSATGNLCLPEYHSWQEMDENSMGNIMQESLVKIFERNQWKELCCNEIARLGRKINGLYGSKEADETREFFVECFNRMKNYRYRAHLLFPYLDYYECTILSMYMVEQDTNGHWLKFTLKGYDKDIFTPEFLRQSINDLITVNEQRKCEGKPKVQLVPYNPEINHIDGCTDLDEQS